VAQFHDDRSHIVATQALRCSNIFRAALVQHGFEAALQVPHRLLGAKVIVVDLLVTERDSFLGAHDVPDAVASQQHKLAIVRDPDRRHVGERRHDLILRLKLRIVFILKVSKRTRQR